MGKSKELLKYGAPLYGVAWPEGPYVYMAGGGNLGIENKVVVVRREGVVLSEEVCKLNVGGDAPYRLAVHPSGQALVLGLTMGGLQRVDIKPDPEGGPPKLSLPKEEGMVERTKPIGMAKGLSFSADGRQLAVGSEEGSITVLEWPGLKRLAQWQASSKAIRNVDFSAPHGDRVLAAVDESGACCLWAAEGGEQLARLEPPADLPRAGFFRCLSMADDRGIALYTAAKWKGQGYVLRWRQGEDGEVRLEARSAKPVTPAPICGFAASPSGQLLAAVTPDGDQCVISAETLRPVKYVRGAHMTFATAVAFAPDESAVVSTSADASATLTVVRRPGAAGGGATALWVLAVLAALLAILLALACSVADAELGWLPPVVTAAAERVAAAVRHT